MEAHLADGRVLEFPDGTDPAVIQDTVQKLIGGTQSPVGHVLGLVGESAGRGVANTYGAVGDITGLASKGMDAGRDWLLNKVGLGPQKNIQSLITGQQPAPPAMVHNPFTGQDQPPPQMNYFMSMPGAGVTSDALKGIGTKLGILGNPANQPQTRGEEYLSKATELGVGGAALPLGNGGLLANTLRNFLIGAGSGVGGEVARGQFPDSNIAPVVGQVAGGLLSSGAVGLGEKLINMLKGDQGIIGDFNNADIKPRLAGTVTDNKFVQGMQNAVKDSPGGATRIQSAAQQQIDDLQAAIAKQADALGGAQTKTEIGGVLQSGAKQAVADFRKTQEGLYNNVGLHFKPDDPVDLANTLKTLQTLPQGMAGAPETAKLLTPGLYEKLTAALAADAPNGAMPYSAFSRMRTEIGKKLGQPQLLDDVSRADLKRLYGAISEDLMQAATNKGPQALDAVTAANNYTREGMRLIEDNLNKIASTQDPAKVLDVVLSGSKDGGKYLNTLKATTYTPEEWNNLSSYVLRNMGKAAPGAQNAAGDAFSPAAFLTNWNKMSPEAKNALFGGQGDLRESLDRLSRISDAMKSSSAMANTSKTAGTAQFLSLFNLGSAAGGSVLGAGVGGAPGAAVGAMAGMAAPTIGQNLAARLLTNPLFVKWVGTPVSADGVPAHIARLTALANSNPALRRDVQQYLDAFQKQNATPNAPPQ